MRVSEFLIRKVGEGTIIPRGYGLAYWDFYRAEGVYYPIPFNLLARLWVRVYYYLMHGLYPNKFEAMLRREYSRGQRQATDSAYQLGRENGYRAGTKLVTEQAIKALDEIAGAYLSIPFEEGKTEAFIQSLEERQKIYSSLCNDLLQEAMP